MKSWHGLALLATLPLAVCALVPGALVSAQQATPPIVANPTVALYDATVLHVADGDTVEVTIDAWKDTPFFKEGIRVYGIDTPEHVLPPAKCSSEVLLGLNAKAYALTLVKPGDRIKVGFIRVDKYGGRVDATLTLPDGRDWATLMLTGKYARPYFGATKSDWCHAAPASN